MFSCSFRGLGKKYLITFGFKFYLYLYPWKPSLVAGVRNGVYPVPKRGGCVSDTPEVFKNKIKKKREGISMKAEKYFILFMRSCNYNPFHLSNSESYHIPMLMMLNISQGNSKATKEDWLYVESIVTFGCIYVCVDYFSCQYVIEEGFL